MKIIRYYISLFLDFLFPKSERVRKCEAMDSHEIVNLLRKDSETMEPPPGAIHSLFSYRNDLVHDLIHEIKYSANRKLAEKIAPELFEACKKFTYGYGAVVTFVPTTTSRKVKRGFDQGSIIISAIRTHDEKLNAAKGHPLFTYSRELLVWNRAVNQQSLSTSIEDRMKNVEFAMSCSDPLIIRDRDIIVIDDVCTTGATLLEAKRALKEAGADKVYLLTIAH